MEVTRIRSRFLEVTVAVLRNDGTKPEAREEPFLIMGVRERTEALTRMVRRDSS